MKLWSEGEHKSSSGHNNDSAVLQWVVQEQQWAQEYGVPIIALYDADRYRWAQLKHYVPLYPHVFERPVIDYRIEAKERPFTAVKSAERIASQPAATQPAAAQPVHGCVGSTSQSPAPATFAAGSSTSQTLSNACQHVYRKLTVKLAGVKPSVVIASVGTNGGLMPIETWEQQDVARELQQAIPTGILYWCVGSQGGCY